MGQPDDLPPTSEEPVTKYSRISTVDNDGSAPVLSDAAIIKKTKDRKLAASLRKRVAEQEQAASDAMNAELLYDNDAAGGYLETTSAMEKTYKFSQAAIQKHVDVHTAAKAFALELTSFGAYNALAYTKNGRFFTMASQKGHVAVMDMFSLKLTSEFHVAERVRDITFLHNQTMLACAQKSATYIYDAHTGAEIHVLNDSDGGPEFLQFLPYHFLLASHGKSQVLNYRDTSTGTSITRHKTKGNGVACCMTQNPWNAVIHLGHASGIVSLWTPNMKAAVVKLQCHQGPVRSVTVDATGHVMATAGADGQVKLWDLRRYQPKASFRLAAPARNITFSQRGCLAVCSGPNVSIWKEEDADTYKPYMNHRLPGRSVGKVAFQPFEDVLACGHDHGLSTMLVPGSGEPNMDSYAANPYETKRQRRETEVHGLLEKLHPSMITLNPQTIGHVNPSVTAATELAEPEAETPAARAIKEKKKMRGRGKISNKLRKKQFNVVDAERAKYREALKENKGTSDHSTSQDKAAVGAALGRFC